VLLPDFFNARLDAAPCGLPKHSMLFWSGTFLQPYSEEVFNGSQFIDLKSIFSVYDRVDYIS